MATLNVIHEKMHKAVAQVGGRIDAVFYCPHAADDRCDCRKPKTGMIEEIGLRFNLELNKVPGVGDALRDLQAFADAGCQPYLVRTGKGEETNNLSTVPPNTIVVADLAAAVQDIIAGDR